MVNDSEPTNESRDAFSIYRGEIREAYARQITDAEAVQDEYDHSHAQLVFTMRARQNNIRARYVEDILVAEDKLDRARHGAG